MKHDTCLRQQFFLQAVRVVNSSACHNKPSHTDLPPVQHQKHSPSHKFSKNLCFLSQRPTTGLHLLRHNKKPLAPSSSLKSQLIVSATFAFSLKFEKKQLSLSSLHFGWHEGNNYSLFFEFKFFFPFEISRYVIILDLANCTPLLLSSPSKSFLSRPAQVLLINNTHVTLLKFLKSHLISNFPETT